MKVINSSYGLAAYAIPRKNILLGKEMKFGGWSPDYQVRLLRRKNLKGWEGKLHEHPVFQGDLGKLKNPMLHFAHRNLSSMVEKTNQWSKIEAELLYKAGHPPITWWRILKMMLREFWQRGVKLKGWRDGTVGWIEVIFQIFSRFLIYASLWELQQQNEKRQ